MAIKAISFWLLYLLYLFLALGFYGKVELTLSDCLVLSVSASLSIVAMLVCWLERRSQNKALFLNFGLFFGMNALSYPSFLLVRERVFGMDRFAEIYFTQYEATIYFLLLPFCVTFAVLHSFDRRKTAALAYFQTLALVGSVWIYLFYPILLNPHYLYSTPDISDYRVLDRSLQKIGSAPNTMQAISKLSIVIAQERGPGTAPITALRGDSLEKRIAELLPYLDGENHMPLVLRPLNLDRFYMAMICIVVLLVFLIYHFVHDPPNEAYVEKIVATFLPYCVFEAVHYYLFAQMTSRTEFIAAYRVGQYFSSVTMVTMLLLFLGRLRFIQSAEGQFYERKLSQNALGITRWRDAFDNWILRQFMKTGELDRRFLVRPEPEPTDKSSKRRS